MGSRLAHYTPNYREASTYFWVVMPDVRNGAKDKAKKGTYIPSRPNSGLAKARMFPRTLYKRCYT